MFSVVEPFQLWKDFDLPAAANQLIVEHKKWLEEINIRIYFW